MWWKFMQDVPFKMAPLSSFSVTRRDLMPNVAQPVIEPEEKELPDGLWESGDKVMARCRSCEQSYEIFCDPEEHTEEYSYCGRSDRCCP